MSSTTPYSAYIGLDVHKDTIAIVVADPERGGDIRFQGNIDNTPDSIRHSFTKLKNKYPLPLLCYEAGPCGYQLYRQLTQMGLECQVVAPSRIPRSSTDRIKNDHRDAVLLAKLLRAGDLTRVWVPDETHEAMRDLIRARSASRKDSKIARQRLDYIGQPLRRYICRNAQLCDPNVKLDALVVERFSLYGHKNGFLWIASLIVFCVC